MKRKNLKKRLKKMYHEINKNCFNGALTMCKIKFIRNDSFYGFCHWDFDTKESLIELSVDWNVSFQDYVDTLAHEMCHHAQLQFQKEHVLLAEMFCGCHGITFYKYAIRILKKYPNITIYNQIIDTKIRRN